MKVFRRFCRITVLCAVALGVGVHLSGASKTESRRPRLVRVNENERVVARYRYDSRGRVAESIYINYPSGRPDGVPVTFTYAYADDGKITESTSTVESVRTKYTYRYNPKGQVQSVIASSGLEVFYEYDQSGRLKQEDSRMVTSASLRDVYTYTWDPQRNVIKIYSEKQRNYVLQSRLQYEFSYGNSSNCQPAIPGRTLHNFLRMPGFWYSANAVTQVRRKHLTNDETDVTTVAYTRTGAGQRCAAGATLTSTDSSLNGKQFTFEYE